ncbi:hypothetical protein IB276_18605 [Ensifer sp. ENS04]|uniref:hypothetical protein n=1 Tax=Ensifer sp. ENS04 TaxID=2769281 RepID=UPI0017801F83|nr:hypothetical protein [Ensifer sp. ENS04]MBD9541468.1 hypothetical protein [Ensifer sp. ENS04]
MKISRLGFNLVFALDIVAFVIASFATTLLTNYLNVGWQAFVGVSLFCTLVYSVIRWLMLAPERALLLAHRSLADKVTDGALAYGVCDLYNMQQQADQERRNKDTQTTIDKAEVMRLAANSGASYLSVGLNRHWPNVRRRLAERVTFKVILLDPSSEERQLRNTINAAGEREDSKLQLGDIIRACNDFPELDVRVASRGMTCSVFITQNEAYFDPYHLAADGGRISNRFLCLRLVKEAPKEGISNYEMLSRHFDTLWAASTPLDQWLAGNGDVRARLPALKSGRVSLAGT